MASEDKEEKKKGKKVLKVLDIVVPVICLVIIAIAGFKLYNIFKGYNEAEKIYDGLAVYVTTDEEEAAETEAEEETRISMEEAGIPYLDIDFEGLKAVNSDFIGWLYFPLLDISYPVVHGDEEQSYLHKAIDGTPSNNGTIYVDYVSDPDMNDMTTIIFGHNMRNGSMFGTLKKIRQDADLIKQDPYFYYYTEDKAYKCHIFAYYLDDQDSITYSLGEKNKAGYDEYLTYVLEKNEYEGGTDGIDFSHRPKLIGLSTCSGHNTGKRTVIQSVVEYVYEK